MKNRTSLLLSGLAISAGLLVAQVVVAAIPYTTTSVLTKSPSSMIYGGTMRLTVTVMSGAVVSTASGTAFFSSGALSLGSAAVRQGSGTLTLTTALKAGVYTGTLSGAFVSGNELLFLSSKATPISLTVSRRTPTVSLSVNSASISYADTATFRATVLSGATVLTGATGTLTFSSGSTTLGTATVSNGSGSLSVTTALKVGINSIVATYGGNANYTSAASSASLVTVAPVVITVKTYDNSRYVGVENPTFLVNYSGFVGGETSAVLTGSPSLTTTASLSSPAGTYVITAAQGTLASANYTFTFVDGELLVLATPGNSGSSAGGGGGSGRRSSGSPANPPAAPTQPAAVTPAPATSTLTTQQTTVLQRIGARLAKYHASEAAIDRLAKALARRLHSDAATVGALLRSQSSR